MLSTYQIRNVLESESDRGAGASKLGHLVYQMLGLEDPATQQRYFRPGYISVNRGHVLESQKATIRPEDINITGLAMAIFGGSDGREAWQNMCAQSQGYPGRRVDVLEAGTDIVPSAFANVSAFNVVAAGLYEAKLLEAYQRPEFIAEQLAETRPSVRRAEKDIGIGLLGDVAEERKPGNAHARGMVNERYITGPVTQNRGLAMDVTREAVMFDLTKQLLNRAESIGEALAIRREYLTLQTVMGVINSYTYDGTNYNTYLAATDNGNWTNKIATNALVDWTNFNAVEKLTTQQVDQETGQPIAVTIKQLLVMPARRKSAEYAMRYTTVARASSGTGAGGLNTALAERGYGPNPYNGEYELLPSTNWLHRLATNSTTDPVAKGLGLADTVADQYWWMGDFKRAFKYNQQLPLTTIRVDANNYDMADRGLVFSIFADEMGIPQIYDPRFVYLSTN